MRIETAVSAQPLSVADLPALDESCGARAIFLGVVRDHDHGQAVTRLEYEAHPQADQMLSELVHRVISEIHQEMKQAKKENLPTQVFVRHRVGALQVGEVAFLAAVDSSHRLLAFSAVNRIVEEVKTKVPIWKHQFYADGSDDWSNCPG